MNERGRSHVRAWVPFDWQNDCCVWLELEAWLITAKLVESLDYTIHTGHRSGAKVPMRDVRNRCLGQHFEDR